MGTDKRERQKSGRQTRLEAAQQQAAKEAQRRRLFTLGSIGLAVVAVVLLIAALGGEDDKKTDAKAKGTTTTAAAASGSSTTLADGAAKPVELKGAGHGKELTGETPCPKADGSSERTTKFAKAPKMCIDPAKKYVASFETSKGNMLVTLDAADAPETVNNFVVLARYHFFDGSPVFRLVKDFAAQFGDPSDKPSNRASFGYQIKDELPKAPRKYEVGSLAMANSGPNTGGAQMFFVLGDKGAALPPQYALFGKVTVGAETLTAINSVPSVQTADNDGAPTEQVTINKVTIVES